MKGLSAHLKSHFPAAQKNVNIKAFVKKYSIRKAMKNGECIHM